MKKAKSVEALKLELDRPADYDYLSKIYEDGGAPALAEYLRIDGLNIADLAGDSISFIADLIKYLAKKSNPAHRRIERPKTVPKVSTSRQRGKYDQYVRAAFAAIEIKSGATSEMAFEVAGKKLGLSKATIKSAFLEVRAIFESKGGKRADFIDDISQPTVTLTVAQLTAQKR